MRCRVGVLLAGCGVYDGSDAQETALVLLALRRKGLSVVALAPDVPQTAVVDHARAEEAEGAQARSVLAESARLSRGAIRSLGEGSLEELDALIIPGGLGVVKNLCLPRERSPAGGDLVPEVAALLDSLTSRHAPVAAIGVSGAVLARHRGSALGDRPLAVPASEVLADEEGRTLFTPGFMGTDDIAEVASGIERLVERLAAWLGAGPAAP